MKAIIIDDERLARKELLSLLENHPNIDVVDEAVNADEAIEKIEEHDPDVIFLDVQMPGKTGFELLETMERVPQVIFTTAYDEFALKAFEFNALDYLLKPIQPERLSESVQKIQAKSSKKAGNRDHKLGGEDQVFVKGR